MATTTNAFGRDVSRPLSNNEHLLKWVEKMAELTTPDAIHWVDGSEQEYQALCDQMVASGTFIKLNEKLWPGCY
jgi:phosphoenolpyruvate carboxykinase (GTP)